MLKSSWHGACRFSLATVTVLVTFHTLLCVMYGHIHVHACMCTYMSVYGDKKLMSDIFLDLFRPSF